MIATMEKKIKDTPKKQWSKELEILSLERTCWCRGQENCKLPFFFLQIKLYWNLKKKKVKEESEKVDLKLNIQKTKIMASGPITSWEIDGETVETVSDFILGGSKITADGDCHH